MYRDAVNYKGVWLAPGSLAMELFKAKKMDALDKLLRETEDSKRKLEGRK